MAVLRPTLPSSLQEPGPAAAGAEEEEEEEEEAGGGLLVRLDGGRGARKDAGGAAAVAAQWFAQFDDPDLAAEDEDGPEPARPSAAGSGPGLRGREPAAGDAAGRAAAGPAEAGRGPGLGDLAEGGTGAGAAAPASGAEDRGLADVRAAVAGAAHVAAGAPAARAGADAPAGAPRAGPPGPAAAAAEADEGAAGFEEVPLDASSSEEEEDGSGDEAAGAGEDSGSDAGLGELDDQGRAEARPPPRCRHGRPMAAWGPMADGVARRAERRPLLGCPAPRARRRGTEPRAEPPQGSACHSAPGGRRGAADRARAAPRAGAGAGAADAAQARAHGRAGRGVPPLRLPRRRPAALVLRGRAASHAVRAPRPPAGCRVFFCFLFFFGGGGGVTLCGECGCRWNAKQDASEGGAAGCDGGVHARARRPPALVSKEEVDEERARLRAVDARPIKKVAEAKQRKRKRLQARALAWPQALPLPWARSAAASRRPRLRARTAAGQIGGSWRRGRLPVAGLACQPEPLRRVVPAGAADTFE